jgi:hypothetical protein
MAYTISKERIQFDMLSMFLNDIPCSIEINDIGFTQMRKTLKTKGSNWTVLAFYTGLSKYESSGKFEGIPKVLKNRQSKKRKHYFKLYLNGQD